MNSETVWEKVPVFSVPVPVASTPMRSPSKSVTPTALVAPRLMMPPPVARKEASPDRVAVENERAPAPFRFRVAPVVTVRSSRTRKMPELRLRTAVDPVTVKSSPMRLVPVTWVQVPPVTWASAASAVMLMPPEITPVPVALPAKVSAVPSAVARLLMAPERVSVAPTPPLTVRVRAVAPRSTGPLSCRLLLPEKVRLALIATALATALASVSTVEAWRVLVPETVNVPDPRDALSPNRKMPADSVVPPE